MHVIEFEIDIIMYDIDSSELKKKDLRSREKYQNCKHSVIRIMHLKRFFYSVLWIGTDEFLSNYIDTHKYNTSLSSVYNLSNRQWPQRNFQFLMKRESLYRTYHYDNIEREPIKYRSLPPRKFGTFSDYMLIPLFRYSLPWPLYSYMLLCYLSCRQLWLQLTINW